MTTLKPFQIQNMIVDATDLTLNGSGGIAIVRLRNAGLVQDPSLAARIIKIEIEARKAIRAEIEKAVAEANQ